MISKLKRKAAHHLVNYKGWTTGRKIVVIESDDWGSIRMPSKKAYNRLLASGVPVDKSPYCRYDSLASEEDLDALFELLSRYKGSDGYPPIITANTVVSNPDFERILESDFREYYCEPITETFKRYPEHRNCLKLWGEAMDIGLFRPQSHGKEHLNTDYWLTLLREGAYDFQLAFEERFWGLSNDVYPEMSRSVQAAFDAPEQEVNSYHEDSAREGLRLFEEIFGYRPESFIANNFIWSSGLNRILKEEGVRYLQGMKYQKLPAVNGHERKMIRHYLGERNEEGQYYLVRNCSFEPSLQPDGFDTLGDCLNAISTAFFWNKPAIISSHRLNYVGFLEPTNRARSLDLLEQLLKEITTQWPEVEFMASDRLGALIEGRPLPERHYTRMYRKRETVRPDTENR